ncbi:hypothetical protein KL918_001922 [Ogataea parapolymorpha]|uniref:ferric-chelate reductase (NADPH) n=1 Tax=Ogataea parapolymorpha (strain ATCC 26012 / BCRC 20466 / JCM 22074 / NRRL Y-7560 / DL-1) TaxID=871575 RepID=W1QCB2_OGAPD|nr:hypothetical protein HPODL_04299 [Ogataea parapolymorpha DL-1]ESW98686.1 hypothetical protein HPODL_04299 [Ogataea parapolymorpha DL-1]KAG7867505.1 hypothetical protein KL916_005397 [Ogataea parapolymorpha]KAG7868264.1 hypothetical protein KL918_001922 [Ogataea parapolymorpha]
MLVARDLEVLDGVHCIADMDTEYYTMLMNMSQAAIPWAHLAVYGKYVTYLLVGIVFAGTIKHYVFSNYDVDRVRGGPARIMEKLTAYSRFIVYRRLPSEICHLLGLPSSVGSLLLIGLVALYSLLWCFVPHPYYRACMGFGSPPLAIRSGMMSTAFVPFIFIMSGKTNIIGFLTGISHEKLNKYHQTASILCLFFGWVHAIPFYIQNSKEGGTARVRQEMDRAPIYTSGIPPIIFLTLLWVGSLQIVRRFWYEAFVSLHWVLAVGFYISLFYHVYGLLNADKYMMATIVIWCAQLLYRWFVKGYLRPSRLMRTAAARARRIGTTDQKCMEVLVETPMKCDPGQHIFLRTLDKKVAELHPFSVIPSSSGFKMIIRAYDGFTKHLYDSLESPRDLNVLVDGPYGGVARDVRSFSNIYLLCSGSGIASCLPFIMAYAKLIGMPAVPLRTIRLDWTLRHADDVCWIEQELDFIRDCYGPLLKNGALDIHIYCCSGETEKMNVSGFEYHSYKPVVADIVKSFQLGSTNCIICSGSKSLKDQVGNAAARLQSQVGNVREVYLHTEEFSF